MEDTICAVSTAPGAGGIAVIRISGPEAIAICNTIFVPRTAGKGLLSQKAYTPVSYTHLWRRKLVMPKSII